MILTLTDNQIKNIWLYFQSLSDNEQNNIINRSRRMIELNVILDIDCDSIDYRILHNCIEYALERKRTNKEYHEKVIEKVILYLIEKHKDR